MKTLRRYIRSVLIEDRERFLAAAAGAVTQGGDADAVARLTKRLWNHNADHRFFAQLVKVHWVNNVENLAFMAKPGPRRDEISTNLYEPGSKIVPPGYLWHVVKGKPEFSLGVRVEGRVTLAANNMSALVTGFASVVKHNDPERYKTQVRSSGLSRRSHNQRLEHFENYILDADSFVKPTGFADNEGVVDNWRPTAIVVGTGYLTVSGSSRRIKLKKAIVNNPNLKRLPVVDFNGNVLDDFGTEETPVKRVVVPKHYISPKNTKLEHGAPIDIDVGNLETFSVKSNVAKKFRLISSTGVDVTEGGLPTNTYWQKLRGGLLPCNMIFFNETGLREGDWTLELYDGRGNRLDSYVVTVHNIVMNDFLKNVLGSIAP